MNNIEKTINETKEIDFGRVFNFAFENYKKIALYAGLMIIVGVFGLSILSYLIFPKEYFGYFQKDNINNLEEQLLSGPYKYHIAVAGLLISLFFAPLVAGFLKMCKNGHLNISFQVKNMFDYFSMQYLIPILVSQFVIALITNIITEILNRTNLSSMGFIFNILITSFFIFSMPLIIFKQVNAIDSLKYSFALAKKNLFSIALFVIIGFVISFIGFFALCLGIFFTIPIVFSIQYALYHEVFGTETEDESEFKTID